MDYYCRDDYGAGLQVVSAWVGIHYFAARHGFGAPNGAVSGESEKSSVLTWAQGNGFLTQALASPLGERLQTGRVVTCIESTRSGVVVEAYNSVTQQLERYQAPKAVVALPAFITARVVVNPPAALLAQAQQIQYPAWSVANIHLTAPSAAGYGAAAEMAWDNVLYGEAPSSLGYASATHQSTAQGPHPPC